MTMDLHTVPVRIKHGVVTAIDGSPLPEQAYALLVIMPEPATDEALAEWQRPFDAFFEQARRNPARNLEQVSEAELNALIHDARQRRQ
jgi:hypothetical protein